MAELGALGGEPVVGSLVAEVRVRPNLTDYVYGFPEKLPVIPVLSGVGVGVKLGPFIGPDAPAETDFDAAPGHVIQDGQVLGQPYGVPPGGDICHLADADCGCPCRQVGSQEYGVRQVTNTVGAEVVLAQPHGLKAQFFGEDGLPPEIVQHVGGASRLSGGSGDGGERCESQMGASRLSVRKVWARRCAASRRRAARGGGHGHERMPGRTEILTFRTRT